MSDDKTPKKSSDGWEMPEPVYRVSEGRTLGADAQAEDVDTLETEPDTIEPNSPGDDSHGYGQDSPDRPMLGPGGQKNRGIGCLILKIVAIMLVLGALILVGLFVTGVGYYFSSGSQANTIN